MKSSGCPNTNFSRRTLLKFRQSCQQKLTVLVGPLENVYSFLCVNSSLKLTHGVCQYFRRRVTNTRWSAHHNAVNPVMMHFSKLIEAAGILSEKVFTREGQHTYCHQISVIFFVINIFGTMF